MKPTKTDSAFPVIAPELGPIMIGLTKRELTSIKMLQAMISGFDPESKANGCFIPANQYNELASSAIQLADELLKQLDL